MKPNVRYLVLGVLLGLVWLTQLIPALATFYSQTVYPCFSYILSSFSNLFPFAIGDLFIFLSIAGIIIYPIYTRLRKKTPWKKILLRDGEYLLWVYVWFYLAWGLNYSQKNFYQPDRNSVYRLHTREFSEVRERIYYPTEPFVHSHKQY